MLQLKPPPKNTFKGKNMDLLQTLEPIRNTDIVMPLLKNAGRYSPHMYPFGNPVSVERCHLPIVQSRKYWIAQKSDGVRVCLLFTEVDKGTPAAMVMDRVGNVYGLPVTCDAELFAGSVFDAELVQAADKSYKLFVFDVAMMEGELLRESLEMRLDLIADVVTSVTIDVPNLHICAKRMFLLSNLREFDLYQKTSDHKSDGYILTPDAELPPAPGTAWSVFKIKASHTIDLLWVDSTLWYGSGEELLRMDALPDWEVSVDGDLRSKKNGTVIEFETCIQGDTTLKLKPVCVRPDKSVPNNALCIVRTIKSIKDAITFTDLLPPSPTSTPQRTL